jgi:hypothetical protein
MYAVGGDVLDDIAPFHEQIEDDPQLAICSADT